jgi:hypothetical protein
MLLRLFFWATTGWTEAQIAVPETKLNNLLSLLQRTNRYRERFAEGLAKARARMAVSE